MILTEHTLLMGGYTYSDINSMTLDQVYLRAKILGSLEFLASSKGMF